MAISLSNFINVSIAKNPTSINERNISVIALFTKEEINKPINNYVIYKSPNQAMLDFGVDSITYKMVNSIFSQSPNILANNGYVVVFPMIDTTISATNGELICNNIIYNNFVDINNGAFNIKVDEEVENTLISGLNFTEIKNIQDLVNVLKANETLTSKVNIVIENDNIEFISKTTGVNSKVIITSAEEGTDITTTQLLNVANAALINGVNEYVGQERLQDVFTRSQNLLYYGACIPCFDAEDSEILATAPLVQATDSMLIIVKDNTSYLADSSANVFKTIQQSALTKTRCLYYNGDTEPLLMACAYVSSYLSVNYSGSNTVKNLHSKELVGILPDETIGETQLQLANNLGVDVYPVVGGVGAVYCSGKNEWFDTVSGLIWLKIAFENAGFGALRNVPTKIAQTEQGISLLYDVYNKVLLQAVNNGLLASGEWTLPFTFGNQELMIDNIRNYGYYIYFEPVANQSVEDREARRAPYAQIAIKLAGAINSSNIIIYVNN